MVALTFSLASPSSISSSSVSVSASLRLHSPFRFLLSPPRKSFLCLRPRTFTPLHLAMASANTAQTTSTSLQQEKSSLPGPRFSINYRHLLRFLRFLLSLPVAFFFASENTSCTTTYISISSVNLPQPFGPLLLFSLPSLSLAPSSGLCFLESLNFL